MNATIDFAGITGISREAASGRARRLLVFLHGYGADAADLLGLAPVLAPRLPDCAFTSVNAPFLCEMGQGRQWFSLADWSPAALAGGVEQALPALNAFIDAAMRQRGLTAGDVALAGFSQGAMMALAAGLRRRDTLGGVIGFSGALTGVDTLAADISARPPVLLVHGTADEIVPFAALGHAETALKRAGVPVESLVRPGLGHGIDLEGIEAALAFLYRIWGYSA